MLAAQISAIILRGPARRLYGRERVERQRPEYDTVVRKRQRKKQRSQNAVTAQPDAAVIITALRNCGIILADNGDSGGLIGTPDARWNNDDLSCITSLTLSDFEPVNVSSLMVSTASGATSH